MKQHEIFNDAKWVSGEVGANNEIFVLRSEFSVEDVKNAKIFVIGLGYFHCYINGKEISDDLFLPLSTDYEVRPDYPTNEVLTGHRIYVPNYDVTSFLKNGVNELIIHFGGGWYTVGRGRGFGMPKAIWRICGEDKNGEFDFVSSEKDLVAKSFVDKYDQTTLELHDYTKYDLEDRWEKAVLAKPLDTEYLFTNCPADKVCESLSVVKVKEFADHTVYDCSKNTTGYPVLEILAEENETVKVEFSEELTADTDIDPKFAHSQKFVVISDGKNREVKPLFIWYGFRYMSVYGNAKVKAVEVVHTKADVLSTFESDNECLNWINKTFINTQLTNMHGGIPSDCPHIERRGYTGDGQLVCHAVMNVLDAKEFYRKWIEDIKDCQDKESGHVQYTAPYIRSGGGPGGWGCAIVEVPYRFYQHYGEKSVLADAYPQMLKYFEYLEAHSENGLVVSDKAGEWCLGDWCTPQQIVLPAPFVNNYFYIKSLMRAIEIAKIIGKDDDIALFEQRIAERKKALINSYYNTFDGNFLGVVQGANAMAVDIGIGDKRTYENLVKYYKFKGGYDTGIFGTDIVTRVLFENGDAELACKLLVSDIDNSFDRMRKLGATTFWEYWPQTYRNWEVYERSHNHPMFGAPVAYMYDHILGVRLSRKEDSSAKIEISLAMISFINKLCGSRVIDGVRVFVDYEKNDSKISIRITLSDSIDAALVWGNDRYELCKGENEFEFEF